MQLLFFFLNLGLPKPLFETQVINHWVLFLSSASALSSLGWPNLWTFIYYTMLLMAALIVIVSIWLYYYIISIHIYTYILRIADNTNIHNLAKFV